MRLVDAEKLNLFAEKAQLEHDIAPKLNRIREIEIILKKEDKINWNEKVVHCLTRVSEPLTTDEILKYIFYKRENEIDNHKVRRIYMTRLSVSLLRLSEKGVIYSEAIEGYRGKIYAHADYAKKFDFALKIEKKKREIVNAKNDFYRLN